MALIGNFSDPSASIMEQAKNGGDVTSQMKALSNQAGDPAKVAGNSMNTPEAQSLIDEQKAAEVAATEQADILSEVNVAQTVQNATQQAQDMAQQVIQTVTDQITGILDTIKAATGKLTAFTSGAGAASGSLPSISNVQGDLGKLGDTLNQSFTLALPEESPVIQDTAETLINSKIKTSFDGVKGAISPVASAADAVGVPGILMITDGLNTIAEMIDGFAALAALKVDESQLDVMASAKVNAAGIASGAAEAAKDATSSAGQTGEEAAKAAKELAATQQALAVQQVNVTAGAFKNMKPPKLPTCIMQQVEDMTKAVTQIVQSIPMVLIGILFGLIKQIFDALTQLAAMHNGTPVLTAPLSSIETILSSVIAIVEFVIKLPMSLVTAVKAILVKKMKVLMLGLTPPAKLPKIDTPALPGGPSDESKGAQAMAKAQFDVLAEFKSH